MFIKFDWQNLGYLPNDCQLSLISSQSHMLGLFHLLHTNRFLLMSYCSQGEKICFIMDESNVLDSSFLERMNTLLANGEVPGLFEGDEYTTLMTQCKEGAVKEGLMLDSQEELYKWFTEQVRFISVLNQFKLYERVKSCTI